MSRLTIDLGALAHNFELCRARVGGSGGASVWVIPVIKANAYGHGAVEVARLLEPRAGVEFFAVAFAEEGAELRRAGIRTRIIVLNASEDSFPEVVAHRLEPEIYNFESLGAFASLLPADAEYPIHIKLDTGMHRLGFAAAEVAGESARNSAGDFSPPHPPRGGLTTSAKSLIEELRRLGSRVRVATIFSHLAAADDPAEDDFTRAQIAEFQRVSSALQNALGYPVRRHLAATSGIERFPDARFDLVRLGLGLYGAGKGDERQAMTLTTRVVNVARLAKGETVGYNRRGVLSRDSVVATVPIGYADGIDRRLSCGRWSVLIGGRPAAIVGNVCMDSLMVDVTDIPGVEVGSRVTIFSPAAGNTIADMAAAMGTIPYEIMTGIAARVKRAATSRTEPGYAE